MYHSLYFLYYLLLITKLTKFVFMIYPNIINQFILKLKKKKDLHSNLNQNIIYRYKYRQLMQFFQN